VTDLQNTLFWLRLVQLLIAIPLLALAGQGVVHVLARMFGQDPQVNIFYKLLRTVSSPITWLCRWITPPFIARRHLPLVALSLLIVGYAWVTVEIGVVCAKHGLSAVNCLQRR
jgi:hypothetical protein